jgi:predicted secreted protein
MGSTVSVPYGYSVAPCNDIPAIVMENAGATLPFVSSDDPTPDTEAKDCTVTFDGTDSQSEAGYFTFGEPYDADKGTGNKHSFHSKFAGTYDGVTYDQGLKMEGSTIIQFTNQSSATVVIVQSTWSDKTLKLDDTELDVSTATTPAGSSGVRVYTIEAVAPGQHKITRGNGESGILRVEVHEKGSSTSINTLLTPTTGTEAYYSLDGHRLTAKPTTKGIYIINGRKVVIK